MLFASTTANIAFACGAAIVSFFLIRRSRRYFVRSESESRQQSRDRSLGAKDLAIVTATEVTAAEVTRGQVQLHDTARDLMGQLDSKMSALQALLVMADEAAIRLRTATEQAQQLGSSLHREPLEVPANPPNGGGPSAASCLDNQP